MRKLISVSLTVLLLASCGGGELTTSRMSNGTTGTNNETTRTNNGDTSATNNQTSQMNNGTIVTATNNNTAGTNNGTTGGTNNGTSGGTTSGTTAGSVDHPMFVAVADFMREKCVNCHGPGENGNYTIPSAAATNAEVRATLENVVSTKGTLNIAPNDPDASQVWVMITNSAGEQFPPETLAIVENWINAGAPYVE